MFATMLSKVGKQGNIWNIKVAPCLYDMIVLRSAGYNVFTNSLRKDWPPSVQTAE